MNYNYVLFHYERYLRRSKALKAKQSFTERAKLPTSLEGKFAVWLGVVNY